jgi:hypothetical protein
MANKPLRKGYYVDPGNDGDWFDRKPPVYGPNSEPFPDMTEEEMSQRLDPAWRERNGLPPLPPLNLTQLADD